MAEPRLKKCPVCRAGMTGEEPLAEPCRRCGSDLSLVRAAERRAANALVAGGAALSAGDAAAAVRWARTSLRLVDTDDARALLGRARALRGGSGTRA